MKTDESEFWKEALRSCHFVVEDPLTEHNLQGPPPAANLQGLPLSPSAVNTEGIFLEQGVLLSMKLHMNSPPVHIVHHQSTYFYHCQV